MRRGGILIIVVGLTLGMALRLNAPPVTAQGAGSVLESDNFSDPNVGLFPARSSTSGVQLGYVGGEYQIARNGVSDNSWITYTNGTYGDVSVEVDARVLGAPDGQFVGVFCRIQNAPDSGYRFAVYPGSGMASLARQDDTTYVVLQSTTSPVPAINTGNASNHLQLVCAGDSISGSVNGTTVLSVQDSVDTNGSPGLTAGSDDQPMYNARFANYVARQP